VANSIDIVVPDLGDFSDVEVIEVLVSAGDRVASEDGLITLETDKASMDVPSPDDGVIESLSVSAGDRINSGDVIGRMSVAGGAAEQPEADPPADARIAEAPVPPADEAGTAAQPGGERTLTVPDIGDFEDVDVIEVHVSEGQVISAEDALITLETDKASMDVPADVGGTIKSVLVAIGDKVSMDSPIAVIEGAGAAAAATPETPAPAPQPEAKPAAPAEKPARPAERTAPAAPGRLPPINEAGFARAHASPSVRKLARELGVDLAQVKGSGAKDRVLHDDVKAFVKAILSGQAAAPAGTGLPPTPKVDFGKFGEIEQQPLTRIQKISGPRLQASWINLPHVTQHDLADITELEARRQKLKGPAREKGIPLTPLAFILKACVAALQEFPKVNASLSEDGEHLVMKKYCHLGFAADTEQGLVVPVIRDADQKDVYELAKDLAELSLAAREGKLKAEQMQGATFTVSSLGGIGGTAFTPIINSPEVAILGVSRHSMQPVWDGEKFRPRLMLPLSFSYDHRVIDGAMAVRFTTFLGEALGDIDSLLQAIP
jgi:pyruvate dehydrogenase E2 component (dihydrolipoamide acetyltransferase)